MGLYIPDLRLPSDDDFELWIAVKKDGSFTYNVREGWHDGKQKAIPVPEPHGRLIDADAFVKKYEEMADKEDGNQLDALILLRWFLEQNAPTIIPASAEVSA